MKSLLKLIVVAASAVCLFGCSKDDEKEPPYEPIDGLDMNTFCFYYNWYGTPEVDGRLYHWAHDILTNVSGGPALGYIPGTGNNIAANYFPYGGIYSSADRMTIRRHMEEMGRAGIGVVAITYWKTADIGHQSIGTIMDEAARVGMKVCFHIEPYEGRTSASTRIDMRGLIDQYGAHEAFYRHEGKPLFFIYDSYLITMDDWAEILSPGGLSTIRGTDYDAHVVGILLTFNDRYMLKTGGFDGAYSYFATTDFTEGSSPSRWKEINEWFESNDMFFVPSVGPGYIDTRVRPWNGNNTRERENGKYYEDMFNRAIDSGARFIAITSYNEWHEGTQIETAQPMQSDDGHFVYLDYLPGEPDFYLTETKRHITRFVNMRPGNN